MPRVKRWVPVAQGFNDDSEGWEFTDQFGDRAFRTWVEILRIIEETENCWRLSGDWLGSLSRKVRQRPASVQLEVDWLLARGWLDSSQEVGNSQLTILKARNYLKFHPMKGTHQAPKKLPPSFLPIPSEETHKNESKPTAAKAAPGTDPEPLAKPKPRPFSPELEAAGMRIYKLDKVKYLRLWEWIGLKRKQFYSDQLLAQVLTRFEPYASDNAIQWWGYLEKIVAKEQSKANGRASEAEGERFKKEEREWLQSQSN